MSTPTPPDNPWSPGRIVLSSRWLQAPMYALLIAVQLIFVVRFLGQFVHLVQAWWGDASALAHVVEDIGYHAATPVTRMTGFLWVLAVLELIETVLVANLLQIMIVGGFRVYVSDIPVAPGRESPAWVRHASVTNLKLKLALGIVGVSSLNLLETFINAANYADRVLWAQAGLHVVLLVSALVVAWIDRMHHQMHSPH
ncbi:YqhA family protein [Ottowia sp. SB7-C50]|uniref:YqhA family protein n=1 Tax=Ottowia sp. SB7-C50 TaxID=3081231 RepID=UPI002952D515|nr:YqhA family protein [Ottowia sp. SB7-C50]WOP14454.1 YqhA family protein [Ottowia sp. SB7-C50]